ncbi:MAG: ABC transporter permease [Corynebacterium sp.]|nr:ABC transporter permease [Corynebacterium sp.]
MIDVRLEWLKMRRQRFMLFSLVAVSACFILAIMYFARDGERDWAGLILSVSFSLALTMPVAVAVIASRHTDIEHAAGGWLFGASMGRKRGTLCQAKLIALVPVMIAVTSCIVFGIMALGFVNDMGPVVGLHYWIGYWISLCIVNICFCALHILLSAWNDNQTVGLGVGVLGAFMAGFSMLLPTNEFWVKLIPWSYYAQITPAMFVESSVKYMTANWGSLAVFSVVVLGAFYVMTSVMNRQGKE